jgi:uncharacterized protein
MVGDGGDHLEDVMAGFHEGELAVQRQAGTEGLASRLSGMLAPADLRGGASMFLAERELLVLTARDRDGRLWTVPIFGEPGFLEAGETTLWIHARPTGPLSDLPAGQEVGAIVIDFETRRRFRVNGTLVTVGDELEIAVEQAFGNCPQYIQQRQIHATVNPSVEWTDTLDTELISRADTFFLGTVHPTRGVDSSHRGGPPGFVRAAGDELWWPDYHGNNMFNSMGNIAVDSSTSLLFLDFDTGRTLHLSGDATLEWTPAGVPGDDDGTGRRVRFTPKHMVSGSTNLLAGAPNPSRRNPVLS